MTTVLLNMITEISCPGFSWLISRAPTLGYKRRLGDLCIKLTASKCSKIQYHSIFIHSALRFTNLAPNVGTKCDFTKLCCSSHVCAIFSPPFWNDLSFPTPLHLFYPWNASLEQSQSVKYKLLTIEKSEQCSLPPQNHLKFWMSSEATQVQQGVWQQTFWSK